MQNTIPLSPRLLYPDFYNNPCIQELSRKCKWTVSDNTKRPINIQAIAFDDRIVGADCNRLSECCMDLDMMLQFATPHNLEFGNKDPIYFANYAFYLDALSDHYVVLDIEPNCPAEIKEQLLNTDYVYGEISLSGKGYHLIYPLPDCINEYPDAINKKSFKEKKWYEIHLEHWITFTRNTIPASTGAESSFIPIFRELASKQKKTVESNIDITALTDNIPNKDPILTIASSGQKFSKTVSDYDNDWSKYEFAYMGYLYRKLRNISKTAIGKGHHYTPEELAYLTYLMAKSVMQHRDKHEEKRENLPWLLYLAKTIAAKESGNKNDNKE